MGDATRCSAPGSWGLRVLNPTTETEKYSLKGKTRQVPLRLISPFQLSCFQPRGLLRSASKLWAVVHGGPRKSPKLVTPKLHPLEPRTQAPGGRVNPTSPLPVLTTPASGWGRPGLSPSQPGQPWREAGQVPRALPKSAEIKNRRHSRRIEANGAEAPLGDTPAPSLGPGRLQTRRTSPAGVATATRECKAWRRAAARRAALCAGTEPARRGRRPAPGCQTPRRSELRAAQGASLAAPLPPAPLPSGPKHDVRLREPLRNWPTPNGFPTGGQVTHARGPCKCWVASLRAQAEPRAEPPSYFPSSPAVKSPAAWPPVPGEGRGELGEPPGLGLWEDLTCGKAQVCTCTPSSPSRPSRSHVRLEQSHLTLCLPAPSW
ncbi:uncharacterized protein LOC121016345 isoform X2 [Herpailurus yagouaroundi]|uniref:uncharacterized protein LOC121016345 isoform X2 n=1 Tax=Herpailurus yagouaroundi TaxID=1608482 RepID=UPI001AD7E22B|nr:uncharacterized protein LOC121016345 isoform X2 [Puma yagouaroundi]